MPQEQAADVAGGGAERHPDADFAGALRGDVRDHAVDADDAEEERDRGSDAEHDERERGLRHRSRLDLGQRAHAGDGQIGVDRPHRLLNLLEQRR